MITINTDSYVLDFDYQGEPFTCAMYLKLHPWQVQEWERIGMELHRLREIEYNEWLKYNDNSTGLIQSRP